MGLLRTWRRCAPGTLWAQQRRKSCVFEGKNGTIFLIFHEEGGARADVRGCFGDAEHHVGESKLSSWRGCDHVCIKR
jgi:hypothetical protein